MSTFEWRGVTRDWSARRTESNQNECGRCGQTGHNARTCTGEEVRKTIPDKACLVCGVCCSAMRRVCTACREVARCLVAAFRALTTGGGYRCAECGQPGHNRQTCPSIRPPSICTSCGTPRPGRPLGLCRKCFVAASQRPTKICKICGNEFPTKRDRDTVCSEMCRRGAIAVANRGAYKNLTDQTFGRWTVVSHPKCDRCAVRCVCGFGDIVSVQVAKNGMGCEKCQRDARHLESAKLKRDEFARIAALAAGRQPDRAFNDNGARPETKRQIVERIKEAPCMDCSGTFPPECMDFDHRDASTKVDGISRLIRSATLERIMEEIAKCDLVCSNCHRVRTKARYRDEDVETVEEVA